MAPPVVDATILATILTATSNVLAQAITGYRSNESFTLDWTPVFHFAIYTLLTCPPNFLWQQFIESVFPGKILQPSTSAIHAAGANDEKELDKEQATNQILEQKLNVPNTVIKLLIDQSLCAGLNTLAFSLAMASFKGATTEQAMQIAKQDFWPIMKAGWRLWPMVSFCNYAFLTSISARTLVGNLAGMAWNIYLSLLTVAV